MLLRLLPLLNQLYGRQCHPLYLAGGAPEVSVWLDTTLYPERAFGTRVYTPLGGELRFEHESYIYPNDARARTAGEVFVPVRETVAIGGPSRSGKSTLAALLLRFPPPKRGPIAVAPVD